MGISQFVHAGISVSACDWGKIVTDRVAWRHQTCILHEIPQDAGAVVTIQRYRQKIISALMCATTDIDTGFQFVRRFLHLAETLESVRAVAVQLGPSNEIISSWNTLATTWVEADQETGLDGCTLLAHKIELLESRLVDQTLLHPLFVALLAYQMGAPINAASTAYAHEWKIPENSTKITGVPAFHIEGDSGDMFDDHRIALVWESRKEKSGSPSGQHHVFLTGDATPHTLTTLKDAQLEGVGSPMIILYNSRSAALYYDCHDVEAVRHSINLDFHVNVVTDSDLEMLSVRHPDAVELEHLTLTQLLVNFPIYDYNSHFDRLLFDPESLSLIFSKLSLFDIPISAPTSSQTCTKSTLEKRFEAYVNDNHAQIPPAILDMEHDIKVSGTYGSLSSLMHIICFKARRDVHLNLGMNLFPQHPTTQHQELARKYFRDLPGDVVSQRIMHYTQTITRHSFTSNDLIPAPQLKALGLRIEMCCFELLSVGFIDSAFMLPSIASFAAAVGSALDGPKEYEITADPCIQDADLEIFRTRCLYLFWCADWLARYLARPCQGSIMVMEVKQQDLVELRKRSCTWLRCCCETGCRGTFSLTGYPGDRLRQGRGGGQLGIGQRE